MYKVIETKIREGGKEELVYGLQHEDGTKVENISADKETAEHLAEYYDKMGLSSCHLKEVVADMADTPQGFKM